MLEILVSLVAGLAVGLIFAHRKQKRDSAVIARERATKLSSNESAAHKSWLDIPKAVRGRAPMPPGSAIGSASGRVSSLDSAYGGQSSNGNTGLLSVLAYTSLSSGETLAKSEPVCDTGGDRYTGGADASYSPSPDSSCSGASTGASGGSE